MPLPFRQSPGSLLFLILYCRHINKIIFFYLGPEPVSEKPEPVSEKPEPVSEKPEPRSEKPEPNTIRNLTLTTYSADGCGGYKVWIELQVNNKTCNTIEIPEFSGGDTLLWFGKYLGSCREFVFEKKLEEINFRVKENNTGDNFCPTYLYAFVDGEGENVVTFKSNYMYCSTCISSYDYRTNDKNHIANKTAGTFYFELPQYGKSVSVG